jgi:hypothetical protein
MAATIDPGLASKTLLETIEAFSHRGQKAFSRKVAIEQTCEKLGIQHRDDQQALVFDAWDDLYRAGIVSYGLW